MGLNPNEDSTNRGFILGSEREVMKTALTEALFLEVKGKFLSTLRNVVLKNKVVPQMIVNWDQTGINVVPASTWTMAEEGSSRVPIAGLGDK